MGVTEEITEGLTRDPTRVDDPDRQWHLPRLPAVDRPEHREDDIDIPIDAYSSPIANRPSRRASNVLTLLMIAWIALAAAAIQYGWFN